MKYLCLSVILFTLLLITCNAQEEISINKKEFRNGKSGFDEAWKHIKAGDSFYSNGMMYGNALFEYQKAYLYNPGDAVLNYKMGVSCLLSDSKHEAAKFLLKSYELKNDVTTDILLATGRAYMFTGEYNKAIEKLNGYLSSAVKKPEQNVARAKKFIAECNSALLITKDTLRIKILNAGGNINSVADEYSEIFTPDGMKMIFGSRRAMDSGTHKRNTDAKFDENIFSSDKVNNEWNVSVIFNINLYTHYCETPLLMDSSGRSLYIYLGYQGGGDIAVSEFKKEKWKTPEPVTFGINSAYPETSIAISPKGDEIVFVSDRGKKGRGGKDLYIVRKMKQDKWSEPVNLGPSVNSEYDEESVRFSRGGDTLWFASMGHNSIGGFDIFYSSRAAEGTWNQAVNAGYPLNTSWDDLFYVPSPIDDSAFFFVSDRSGGYGGLDIYTGRLLPQPSSSTQLSDTIRTGDGAATKETDIPSSAASDAPGIKEKVIRPISLNSGPRDKCRADEEYFVVSDNDHEELFSNYIFLSRSIN